MQAKCKKFNRAQITRIPGTNHTTPPRAEAQTHVEESNPHRTSPIGRGTATIGPRNMWIMGCWWVAGRAAERAHHIIEPYFPRGTGSARWVIGVGYRSKAPTPQLFSATARALQPLSVVAGHKVQRSRRRRRNHKVRSTSLMWSTNSRRICNVRVFASKEGGFEAFAPLRASSEHRKVAFQHMVAGKCLWRVERSGFPKPDHGCKVGRCVFSGVKYPLAKGWLLMVHRPTALPLGLGA